MIYRRNHAWINTLKMSTQSLKKTIILNIYFIWVRTVLMIEWHIFCFYTDNKTIVFYFFFSLIEFFKEYDKVLLQVDSMLPCFYSACFLTRTTLEGIWNTSDDYDERNIAIKICSCNIIGYTEPNNIFIRLQISDRKRRSFRGFKF